MLYTLLIVALIAIDQVVKLWVRGNIPLGESIPFIPYIMDLSYVQNTGAAFSIFSQHTWMLTLISLAVSIFIVVLLFRPIFTHWWGKLSLALVLAGAVGNLIDRALFSFVTDMFRTTFINFAVFNVADICVVIGGISVCVYVIFFYDKWEGKDEEKDEGEDEESTEESTEPPKTVEEASDDTNHTDS